MLSYVLFVVKNKDGTFSGFDAKDLDSKSVGDLTVFEGASSGLLGEEDASTAAEAIEPGTAAIMIMYENRWAGPFVAAVRRNGGVPIAFQRHRVEELIKITRRRRGGVLNELWRRRGGVLNELWRRRGGVLNELRRRRGGVLREGIKECQDYFVESLARLSSPVPRPASRTASAVVKPNAGQGRTLTNNSSTPRRRRLQRRLPPNRVASRS